MLTGPYFKPFQDTLNLSKYSFALPFRWDEHKKKLELVKSKVCYFVMILGLVISITYVFILVYQLLTKFSQMTPEVTMILLIWLTVNLAVAFSKLAILLHQGSVTEFFNRMIQFEKVYFAGNETKGRKTDFAVLLVLKMTFLSVASFPLAVTSYIALKPCTPPFITSYILQCKDAQELIGFLQIARLLLAISEGMFWFHIVGMSAFIICFVQYLSQQCLKMYLVDLRKMASIGTGHYKQGNIYRQIQTLHCLLNSILRGEIIPTAQFCWTTVTIVALYTSIKLNQVLEFPLYLFFPMLAIDGFIFFYVVVGASAQSYLESYNLLHVSWKKQVIMGQMTGKWFPKFRRSCRELKTFIGSVNFIRETTPVAIIHFCLAQTGGLILLGN